MATYQTKVKRYPNLINIPLENGTEFFWYINKSMFMKSIYLFLLIALLSLLCSGPVCIEAKARSLEAGARLFWHVADYKIAFKAPTAKDDGAVYYKRYADTFHSIN